MTDKFINLCPHPINIGPGDHVIPPDPRGPLRLREEVGGTKVYIEGKPDIPIYPPAKYTGVYLEKEPGLSLDVFRHKTIIVSQVVAEYWTKETLGGALSMMHRTIPPCNVLVPNTSPGHAKRSANGQIESVDSLRLYVIEDEGLFKTEEGHPLNVYEFMY